ncbi:hypothetical protein A2U01_0058657, partial [Trifolium medium]|nr:hypothetical protein [Trifolium medium]
MRSMNLVGPVLPISQLKLWRRWVVKIVGGENGGSVEEREEEERVDFHSNLHLQHGEMIPSHGDGSSAKEDNRQSLFSVSAINLEVSEDIRVQNVVLPESFVGSK